MEKKRVVVIKDVFREDSKIKEFSGYHAIAYAGIQTFYHPMMQANVLTLQTLYFVMGIKNARTQKNIKDAIMDLIKWGLIKINQDEFNNNTPLIIVIPKVDTTDSKFATINKQFVWDILISEYSVQEKGNMLLVYMVLAQYMGKNILAFPNIETIMTDSGLSKPTVSKTLKNLKHNNVIDYGNNNTYNGYLVGNIYVFCDTPNYNDILKSEMSQLTSAEVNKNEWLNTDCSVYIVRLYDEYEDFYKIGITVDVPRRLGQIPYKHEIIKIVETNMYEAYYLENELHQKYRQYSYLPSKDFGGKTECFHYIY